MKKLIVLAALVVASPTHAEWKPQYADASQAVKNWYAGAKLTQAAHDRLAAMSRDGQGFWGCCDSSEVVKTKFKVDRSSGQDVWLYLKDGKYEPIPSDIIHFGESAPDGQPTLFVLADHYADAYGLPHGTLSCFYPPPGGI